MPEKQTLKPEDIELHPDAWQRFEEFVKRIVRAGPQHRLPKKAREPLSTHGGRKNKD